MTNPFRVGEVGLTRSASNPVNSVRLSSGVVLPGRQADAFGRVLDDAAQFRPANASEPPNTRSASSVDAGDLALDLTQIALDIVGIFEPTPFADGANTLISIGRGDGWGALMSAAGMIPYVGDAAKLGKLGRWGKTVADAVDLATSSPALARTLSPALRKIKDALDAIPEGTLSKLPDDAQATLRSMKSKLDDFFSRGADDAGQAVARRDMTVLRRHADGNMQVLVDGKRYNLPPGKTVDDIPLTDPVGDTLQNLTTEAAGRWDPRRNLSPNERRAIAEARRSGEHWRATLLEKQAKGRWVESQVRRAAEEIDLDVTFSRVGLDATSGSNLQYDIMSGTVSNMDRHARREPDTLFRMITFE